MLPPKILGFDCMNQTIYTKRLILRKFERSDIKDIYKIFSDIDTNRFLPWYPLESEIDAERFYKERYAEVYCMDSDMPMPCALKRTMCR